MIKILMSGKKFLLGAENYGKMKHIEINLLMKVIITLVLCLKLCGVNLRMLRR